MGRRELPPVVGERPPVRLVAAREPAQRVAQRRRRRRARRRSARARAPGSSAARRPTRVDTTGTPRTSASSTATCTLSHTDVDRHTWARACAASTSGHGRAPWRVSHGRSAAQRLQTRAAAAPRRTSRARRARVARSRSTARTAEQRVLLHRQPPGPHDPQRLALARAPPAPAGGSSGSGYGQVRGAHAVGRAASPPPRPGRRTPPATAGPPHRPISRWNALAHSGDGARDPYRCGSPEPWTTSSPGTLAAPPGEDRHRRQQVHRPVGDDHVRAADLVPERPPAARRAAASRSRRGTGWARRRPPIRPLRVAGTRARAPRSRAPRAALGSSPRTAPRPQREGGRSSTQAARAPSRVNSLGRSPEPHFGALGTRVSSCPVDRPGANGRGRSDDLRFAEDEAIDVPRYLAALRRGAWLIVAHRRPADRRPCSLLSLVLPKTYAAEATLVLDDTSTALAPSDAETSTQRLATIRTLLVSHDVLEQAAAKLDGETADTLEDKVDASVDDVASLITVKAEDGDAAGAAAIANGVAATYLERRQRRATAGASRRRARTSARRSSACAATRRVARRRSRPSASGSASSASARSPGPTSCRSARPRARRSAPSRRGRCRTRSSRRSPRCSSPCSPRWPATSWRRGSPARGSSPG